MMRMSARRHVCRGKKLPHSASVREINVGTIVRLTILDCDELTPNGMAKHSSKRLYNESNIVFPTS